MRGEKRRMKVEGGEEESKGGGEEGVRVRGGEEENEGGGGRRGE